MNKILLSTATALMLSLTACSSHAPKKRVHRILTDRIQTLAVAESCTGGTIAARFTALPGASAYFKCGVVAYRLDGKSAATRSPATAPSASRSSARWPKACAGLRIRTTPSPPPV